MQRSRISQLIQMGSIGISDTTSVDGAVVIKPVCAGTSSAKREYSVDKAGDVSKISTSRSTIRVSRDEIDAQKAGISGPSRAC